MASGKCCIAQGVQTRTLDSLEGWAEGWGGREVLEGGGICISMADSHCCMAETNTSL